MEITYWHKQMGDKPLFPDLLWSRPENKRTAGKLLVVGGNIHGFSAIGQAYGVSIKAGIGTVRVLLPDSLQKTVSKLLPEAEFAASNKSGGLGVAALAQLMELASWADGVLLAGDFGRNSETSILIEKFLTKYKGQVTLVNDTCEYVTSSPNAIIKRDDTTVVMTMAQLQRLLTAFDHPKAITLDMPLLQLIEILHELTLGHSINIVTKQLDNIIVAVRGEVSTTKLEDSLETWRTATAAQVSVWWLQNPDQTFETLTTAVVGGEGLEPS